MLGIAGTLTIQRAIPEADAGKNKKGPLEREEFHQTLDVVLDRYVEPVDAPQVMARGLKHMVSGLDPYSHYLTADERAKARKLQQQGAEAGLMTTLHRDAQRAELEIVGVHPGSPADKLGLGAGDRILEIRGQPCAHMLSNVEAQLLLGGAAGERIELVLERGKGPERVEVELAKPDVDALVSTKLLEVSGHAIGQLEIHAFRTGTGELVKRELAELRRSAGERGLAGLIVDLRGNPGGEVAEAVLVADLFVEEGVLTRTRGRGGVILREELATAAGTDVETPLIVLQDRRSASAAELLAVALQDNDRAKVIGERSFGKGTVQEVIGIPDGSVLTLTVARYFSPSDRLIDGRGVEPDVLLKNATGEAALDAAARELVEQIADNR
ncbi:MAG TPA: S41 family peptidase [Enhygromyxa sp.]|nr:S41 family peptidase [Enhygromyxa sp.]